VTLGKIITVIPLLSNSFIEEKDFWIELKECNKVLQWLSIEIPIIAISSTFMKNMTS